MDGYPISKSILTNMFHKAEISSFSGSFESSFAVPKNYLFVVMVIIVLHYGAKNWQVLKILQYPQNAPYLK